MCMGGTHLERTRIICICQLPEWTRKKERCFGAFQTLNWGQLGDGDIIYDKYHFRTFSDTNFVAVPISIRQRFAENLL